MTQPKLSVVIVNFNVRHFLEQCLQSVIRAGKDIPLEIFVVDNNSVDGSVARIKAAFPDVILIENHENLGFSKANNQAIRKASGEYILLLNPDTVVEEDTFAKVIRFMDEHPDSGALGVKMIDGKGHFLPESKRALPTPWVSFYKISGLSALFPKSEKFGRYHLGYLNPDQIHQVDVLPGAFMLLRQGTLKKTGLLDETFFMYGEDIDLSFRITQAGYHNYYFPETTIIHYKGESTKKGSINYVKVFYQAMIIFADKHFSKQNARWYSLVIRLAIYIRATLSLLSRFFNRAFLPVSDALLLFSGFVLLNPWWEKLKFPQGGGHPPEFLRIFVPAYSLIWILSIFFSGGYDKPISIKKHLKGMAAGTILILAAYSLLPEQYRFSRALILLGATWGTTTTILFRLILHLIKFPGYRLSRRQKKRLVIVGSPDEAHRVKRLLKQSGHPLSIAGLVSHNPTNQLTEEYVGTVDQMHDIIAVNKADEIIFCGKDLSTGEIIRYMLAWSTLQVDYKIAPSEGEAILGSNSANRSGDLYQIPINSIGETRNRRVKRVADVTIAVMLLCTSPLLIWLFLPRPFHYLKNILLVLAGVKTWISFGQGIETPGYELPSVKPGILTPLGNPALLNLTADEWLAVNLDYARDYSFSKDIRILFRYFKSLNC